MQRARIYENIAKEILDDVNSHDEFSLFACSSAIQFLIKFRTMAANYGTICWEACHESGRTISCSTKIRMLHLKLEGAVFRHDSEVLCIFLVLKFDIFDICICADSTTELENMQKPSSFIGHRPTLSENITSLRITWVSVTIVCQNSTNL